MLGDELLQGEHVYLTALTKEILESLRLFTGSVEYIRAAGDAIAFPRPLDKIWEGIEDSRKESGGYVFSIYTRADNTLLGTVGIQHLNWQMRHGDMEIGIPDPDQRGKGYGRDAVGVLLKYAFLELNLNRVGLRVPAYNEAAIACFQKAGFQHEATLRESIYRDLQYYDAYIMGILYDEWMAKNGS